MCGSRTLAVIYGTLHRRCVTSGSEARGGIPAVPGFYAWWLASEDGLAVPVFPHPTDRGLGLLYVGVAPRTGRSKATLRSRVLDNTLA